MRERQLCGIVLMEALCKSEPIGDEAHEYLPVEEPFALPFEILNLAARFDLTRREIAPYRCRICQTVRH